MTSQIYKIIIFLSLFIEIDKIYENSWFEY